MLLCFNHFPLLLLVVVCRIRPALPARSRLSFPVMQPDALPGLTLPLPLDCLCNLPGLCCEFLAINDEELIDTVSRGFFSDSELVRIYYGTVRLGVDLHQTEPHWLRVENDSVIVAKLPAIGCLDFR